MENPTPSLFGDHDDGKIDEMITAAEEDAGVVAPRKGDARTGLVATILEVHRTTLETLVTIMGPRTPTVVTHAVDAMAPRNGAHQWDRSTDEEVEKMLNEADLTAMVSRIVRNELTARHRDVDGVALTAAALASRGATFDSLSNDLIEAWKATHPGAHLWERAPGLAECVICKIVNDDTAADARCNGGTEPTAVDQRGIFDAAPPSSEVSDAALDAAFAEKKPE